MPDSPGHCLPVTSHCCQGFITSCAVTHQPAANSHAGTANSAQTVKVDNRSPVELFVYGSEDGLHLGRGSRQTEIGNTETLMVHG